LYWRHIADCRVQAAACNRRHQEGSRRHEGEVGTLAGALHCQRREANSNERACELNVDVVRLWVISYHYSSKQQTLEAGQKFAHWHNQEDYRDERQQHRDAELNYTLDVNSNEPHLVNIRNNLIKICG